MQLHHCKLKMIFLCSRNYMATICSKKFQQKSYKPKAQKVADIFFEECTICLVKWQRKREQKKLGSERHNLLKFVFWELRCYYLLVLRRLSFIYLNECWSWFRIKYFFVGKAWMNNKVYNSIIQGQTQREDAPLNNVFLRI